MLRGAFSSFGGAPSFSLTGNGGRPAPATLDAADRRRQRGAEEVWSRLCRDADRWSRCKPSRIRQCVRDKHATHTITAFSGRVRSGGQSRRSKPRYHRSRRAYPPIKCRLRPRILSPFLDISFTLSRITRASLTPTPTQASPQIFTITAAGHSMRAAVACRLLMTTISSYSRAALFSQATRLKISPSLLVTTTLPFIPRIRYSDGHGDTAASCSSFFDSAEQYHSASKKQARRSASYFLMLLFWRAVGLRRLSAPQSRGRQKKTIGFGSQQRSRSPLPSIERRQNTSVTAALHFIYITSAAATPTTCLHAG